MFYRFTLRGLLIVLLFTQCALAQEPGSVLYGSWTATAGPSQIFRGTWSAETSRRIPNEAQGSWTLVDDSGEVVLQGTVGKENGLPLARNLESSDDQGPIVFWQLGSEPTGIDGSDIRHAVKAYD